MKVFPPVKHTFNGKWYHESTVNIFMLATYVFGVCWGALVAAFFCL